jgi:ATP-dependent helicase YprA (DUF1998 family)
MPINPVHFAHGVCDEFLRYLFSAFPLSDPELAEQARKLLERSSSLDIPLVQGPFVSLSEAFAKGELVQKLADQGTLHHAMPGLIGYPSMWKHQQQVFEAVKAASHVLVATGTGSGKTEAFLYPIVDDLLRQRDRGITTGLTAILIYPMNALANDQLDRLRDMLGGTGITFGQWVGTTPGTEGEVTVDRFPGSGRAAYLAERKKRRDEAQAEDRAVRPLAPPEECCSEEDIRERKPRILLTNYRQLEVLTTRSPDVAGGEDRPAEPGTATGQSKGTEFDGKIYLSNNGGTTFVFKAGQVFSLLATNKMSERITASPAITGDWLIYRTDSHLFCIGRVR